jgi:uncharacterized membrane protein YfcA
MSTTYRQKSLIWFALVLTVFIVALLVHGGIDPGKAVLLICLCFACELVDSGLGMGYGTILTPTLLLLGYSAEDIVPTVLLSELLSGSAAAFFHHQIHNVDLGLRGKDFVPALILAVGSFVGVSVGVFVAVTVSTTLLSMVIGSIILMSGLFVILLSRRVVPYSKWRMIVLATVASFNKAVSGGGYGPVVTSGQILSGIPGRSSVGITSLAEAFTCLLGVCLFLAKGGHIAPLLLLPMVTGALLSIPFAVFAINKANEDQLKSVIGALTVVMGAATIYKALT